MSTEANKDVVRRFVDEVANQHHADRMEELCTADHVLYHPAIPRTAIGIGEYRWAMDPVWQAWPDHHLEIQDITAEGDRVAMRAVVTARNTGEMRGAKPTGKSTRSTVIATYRIRDGKIAETRVIEDIMTMLHDAGQVPRNLTAVYWLKKVGFLALLQKLGKIPGAEAMPEPEAAAAPPTGKENESGVSVEEKNKETIRYFYDEIWNKGNYDVADEVFSPEFVGHAPGDLGVVGNQAVKGFVKQWRDAFPDLKIEIDAQFAEGEKVATRFTCTGTNHGSLMGIPPTGKFAKMYGAAISRVVDGKVMSDWGEFDVLGLLMQLGVVDPSRGGPGGPPGGRPGGPPGAGGPPGGPGGPPPGAGGPPPS
jgi:steroid delta-isomerase-like uncharacterized protein